MIALLRQSVDDVLGGGERVLAVHDQRRPDSRETPGGGLFRGVLSLFADVLHRDGAVRLEVVLADQTQFLLDAATIEGLSPPPLEYLSLLVMGKEILLESLLSIRDIVDRRTLPDGVVATAASGTVGVEDSVVSHGESVGQHHELLSILRD